MSIPPALTNRPTREQLLHLLRTGHVLTTKEAAKQIGVSSRQISRAANTLIEEGEPIQVTKQGNMNQYALPEGERYPEHTDQYTENQLLALIVAIEAGRALLRPTPLAKPLRAVYDDLMARIPNHNVFTLDPGDENTRWYFQEARSVRIDPEVFKTVRQAIHEQRTIAIDYQNASKQTFDEGRVIDPLVIGTRKGAWLVASYCHKRTAIRDFNLAEIKAITFQDAHFTPPDDFDAIVHFGTRFGATTGEGHFVKVRVAPKAAPYFHRKIYHPTQQIEHRGDDGHLIVSFDVEGLKDIRSWVRSWGPKVTVLEPEELVNQVQTDAQAMLDQYRAASSTSVS